jgi:SAM-dependent methyltransferase
MPEAPARRPSLDVDAEIARLTEPGTRANAWRPDFDEFRERRLRDEDYQAFRVRLLRRLVPGLRRRTILDLGSGRGGLAVALRLEGFTVVALDVRRSNCRLARLRGLRHGVEMSVVRARGEFLPFPRQSFGVIVCRDVLEHCDEPRRLLREIWRVLRRGGACYLTVMNRRCWIDPHYHLAGVSYLPRAWAERYIEWRGRAKESGSDRQRLSDMHYYLYWDFVAEAKRLGFTVRDVRAETLARRAAGSVRGRAAWWTYRMLRPLSLQAAHFDFLLGKPKIAASGPAAS